jgi:hypothetical protein
MAVHAAHSLLAREPRRDVNAVTMLLFVSWTITKAVRSPFDIWYWTLSLPLAGLSKGVLVSTCTMHCSVVALKGGCPASMCRTPNVAAVPQRSAEVRKVLTLCTLRTREFGSAPPEMHAWNPVAALGIAMAFPAETLTASAAAVVAAPTNVSMRMTLFLPNGDSSSGFE